MKILGKYNSAKVFTDNLEEGAKSQIIELLDQSFIEGAKVRIMPDVHVGMGSVIGFTGDLGDKVIPNIVGVDIGCGVLTVELGNIDIDLPKLDNVIKREIPSGFRVHQGRKVRYERLQDLHSYRELKDTKRIERSIGTLGGGNHFIEINIDSKGKKYLNIHSGSRNLGHQVASLYQKLATEQCSKDESKKHIPRALCYLTGEDRNRYLNDMKICQEYASLNRETMADIIIQEMFNKSLEDFEYFETVHNYIDFKDNIVRKGAVAAYEGQKILIPINMRDGSIIAVGKGNPDWNYSAPHGAGRLMSRTQAKSKVTMEEFEASMKGIYSSSVNKKTLDESPMAYKSIEEILENVNETAEVIDIIKPIYNYKA